MNQEQYEAAVKVIVNDCEIRYTLIDDQGRTCPVGALAVAAGWTANMGFGAAYKMAEKLYGLTSFDINHIWVCNDMSGPRIEIRRRAVFDSITQGVLSHYSDVKAMSYAEALALQELS